MGAGRGRDAAPAESRARRAPTAWSFESRGRPGWQRAMWERPVAAIDLTALEKPLQHFPAARIERSRVLDEEHHPIAGRHQKSPAVDAADVFLCL